MSVPVLSWSLGCQPEYLNRHPQTPPQRQHPNTAAAHHHRRQQQPRERPPPPTAAREQQPAEAPPAASPRKRRHTCTTLPVPRKGPRPARSELSPPPLAEQHTSPSPACPETQDPLPGKARLARPSEPILVPKLRIKIADFPYLH